MPNYQNQALTWGVNEDSSWTRRSYSPGTLQNPDMVKEAEEKEQKQAQKSEK